MTLARWLRRAWELPPHITARKAVGLGLRHWRDRRGRRRDQRRPSFSPVGADGPLERFYPIWPGKVLTERAPDVLSRARRILDHEFNLLGSEWCQVQYGLPCAGFGGETFEVGAKVEADANGHWLETRVNPANVSRAQQIWSHIEAPYQPIDWQLDFRSGYRWDSRAWFRDVPTFAARGADIKVPWELGRMQHLPWLAAAFALGRAGHPEAESPETYMREYVQQVLDFIATNPPRFGVQWCCPMDVALRAVSWLVTHDLLVGYGAEFPESFEKIFAASLRDHGRHVSAHLEWDPLVRGNHYLADICGLAYLGAYLPSNPETESWLQLASQELVREIRDQFHPDGGNFEASTGYHLLSAEMVLHTTALLLALPDEKQASIVMPTTVRRSRSLDDDEAPREEIPRWPPDVAYVDRLAGMERFCRAAADLDGIAPAVGDHDSGRFLRLLPRVDEDGVDLELDYASLIHGFPKLLGKEENDRFPLPQPALARYQIADRLRDAPSFVEIQGEGLRTGLRCHSFPDSGFRIYRSERLHLLIRCGSYGQNGNGGHAHNDQLSFTMSVDGCPLFIDPGSFVYSPFPEERNRFRSTAMHNTLQLGQREQSELPEELDGLFRLPDQAHGEVRQFDGDAFEGFHRGFGLEYVRRLEVQSDGVSGFDMLERPETAVVRFHLAEGVLVEEFDPNGSVDLVGPRLRALFSWDQAEAEVEESLFSPGYGVVQPNHTIVLRLTAPRFRWQVTVV